MRLSGRLRVSGQQRLLGKESGKKLLWGMVRAPLRVTWEALVNAWKGREATTTSNGWRHESPHRWNLLLFKHGHLPEC